MSEIVDKADLAKTLAHFRAKAALDMDEFVRISNAKLVKALNNITGGAGVSSENRLDVFLALTRKTFFDNKPPEVFWPVFHNTWTHCDSTWHLNAPLLDALRRNAPGTSFLKDANLVFFNSLPDPVRVYRGCSSPRVMGASWTTDRAVAEKFAHGHRMITPSPVIATGLAHKAAVFGAYTGRNESELVLDPKQLTEISIEKRKRGDRRQRT